MRRGGLLTAIPLLVSQTFASAAEIGVDADFQVGDILGSFWGGRNRKLLINAGALGRCFRGDGAGAADGR